MPTNPRGTPVAPNTSDAERLRHKIDTGKTGDKVGVPDPAASPLGTDDEASQVHDEEGLKVARQAPRPSRPK
jgi:hypothetical protein